MNKKAVEEYSGKRVNAYCSEFEELYNRWDILWEVCYVKDCVFNGNILSGC